MSDRRFATNPDLAFEFDLSSPVSRWTRNTVAKLLRRYPGTVRSKTISEKVVDDANWTLDHAKDVTRQTKRHISRNVRATKTAGTIHRGSAAGLRNGKSTWIQPNHSGYAAPDNQLARYGLRSAFSAPSMTPEGPILPSFSNVNNVIDSTLPTNKGQLR